MDGYLNEEVKLKQILWVIVMVHTMAELPQYVGLNLPHLNRLGKLNL